MYRKYRVLRVDLTPALRPVAAAKPDADLAAHSGILDMLRHSGLLSINGCFIEYHVRAFQVQPLIERWKSFGYEAQEVSK